MPSGDESLFSLELVVEKIYIPHTVCHFPAIAFRLLDFPTILISHVESNLSTTIKSKISRDPYYRLPAQFSELKDAQGNFMVKKGKSCLFKISVETLKMHLCNTPLYVMVIDTYPDTPKLLGNSTVPLNSLMDNICVDIAKFGSTIPSVHGDKGLFKLYSLMGKEIGYFVLGFRLLCLGPGLIPHLPEATLATQRLPGEKEKQVVQEAVNQSKSEPVKEHVKLAAFNSLNDTHEMGSMTDVETRDAILQTMNFHDKAVHVAISAPDEGKTVENVTVSTQTERWKQQKQRSNLKKEFTQYISEKDEDDDTITQNIVCPPPMFYNSKCDPKIKMQKHLHYDATTFENDLMKEDFENEDLSSVYTERENATFDDRIKQSLKHDKSLKQNFVHDLMPKAAENKHEVFPVLTALLNELTGIQSANFLEAIEKINHIRPTRPQIQTVQPKALSSGAASRRLEELSKPRRSVIKVDFKSKGVEAQQAKLIGESVNQGRKNETKQVALSVTKNKGWLRQVPGQGVKKSPLAFGLTLTQRLRLAKTNPEWLKAVEQQKADFQKQKEEAFASPAVDSDVDLNVTNLSDTLTEVRRLAQKELERGNQTLDTMAVMSTPGSEDGIKGKREATTFKSRSPTKGKNWLQRYGRRSPSPKSRSKSPKCVAGKKKIGDRKQTTPKHKQISHKASIDEISQTSDQQSQKSIEVHVPSAQIDEEEYLSDITLDNQDTMPDDFQKDTSKFQGFGREENLFPESIDGQVNISLSETRISDQPLESTRLSTNEVARHKESSDYDTHQFMSTEEPELQGLMSDEEGDKSDSQYSGRQGRLSGAVVSMVNKFQVVNPVASKQSPIPATRRSTIHLDAGPHREQTQQADTPRSQDSTIRPTPRPRGHPGRLGRDSRNTDSVSSYQPSDPDNALVSLSDANYSDDFHPVESEFDDSLTDISSPEIYPKFIPSTKLGYTIS